jgi:hypothetical protein
MFIAARHEHAGGTAVDPHTFTGGTDDMLYGMVSCEAFHVNACSVL